MACRRLADGHHCGKRWIIISAFSRRYSLAESGSAAASARWAAAWGAAPRPAPPAASAPRNVLFIAVDDLRPQLGCYGNPVMHTPNIDALAARGMVFSRAYCQQAVCNPSRASLLTGMRPDTTRIYNLATNFRVNLPDAITLPEYFKQHGYHSEGLSKIFHGGLDDAQSWSVPHWAPRGNTYVSEAIRRQVRLDAAKLEKEGVATTKHALKTDPKTGTVLQLSSRKAVHGPSWEDPDVPDNALYDGKTADHAIELLQQYRGRPQPFFLAVGFLRPHLPFVAPRRYFDLYPLEKLELAPNQFPPQGVPEVAMYNSQEFRDYTDIPDAGPIPEAALRKAFRAYCASVSYVDAQVGRLMAELDRLGLRDNTVVVLWGDHGWHLGEQDIWGKMTNFEVATHAPLILSAPNQKHAGTHTDALVEFVDIYPTLCQLCDLPIPEGLEGRSMVPVMEQPGRRWKSAAFSQYPRKGGVMGYSMRTDRYRYTEWRQREEVVGRELYDYQEDPQGNVNVAERTEQAKRVEALQHRLAEGWKGALPASRKSARPTRPAR